MHSKCNKRLYWELEQFIVTILKRSPHDKFWEHYPPTYLDYSFKSNCKAFGDCPNYPQLTNHEICHEMFWNAFKGRSKMYIQLPNLTNEESIIKLDKEENITLSCTLLTFDMLYYDTLMFHAMNNQEDIEYRDAAISYYRPYLFSYVAEIDHKKLRELQILQKQIYGPIYENAPDARDIWLECAYDFYKYRSPIELNGYVVQSASNIDKFKVKLRIIEDDSTCLKFKKAVLDTYKLQNAYINDQDFVNKLQSELNDCLSSIYIYRIGNGNCIYAQNAKKDMSFFFDIGFNYKHRPKMLSAYSTYNYSSAMKKVLANDPSFFILSHWDLDHIAGSFAARKNFLDKKWFAPDCYDACIDARRLAKYLEIKGNLFCVARNTGRMIGQINIGNKATYKLFIGEKVPCDNSFPNCEGIVIKYKSADKTVMMMGDVNYASFNKAIQKHNVRIPTNPEPLFAGTKIDFLIVPHHGSKHTDYSLITDQNPIIQGTSAIICCTDNAGRPDISHKKKLSERFHVYTTQSDGKSKDYIEIQL